MNVMENKSKSKTVTASKLDTVSIYKVMILKVNDGTGKDDNQGLLWMKEQKFCF